MDPRRPHTATLIIFGVSLLGAWNAARLFALMRQWALLQRLEVTPAPLLQIGLAFVWTLLFGGTAVALWQKRPFVRQWIPLVFTLYAVSNLSLTIGYAHIPIGRWLVNVLAYAAAVLLLRWGLIRLSTQQYFSCRSSR